MRVKSIQALAHTCSLRAGCSEAVLYQDHVGHLEAVITAPKVQSQAHGLALQTVTHTIRGKPLQESPLFLSVRCNSVKQPKTTARF